MFYTLQETDNAVGHPQPCFAYEAIYATSLTGSSPFTHPPNLAPILPSTTSTPIHRRNRPSRATSCLRLNHAHPGTLNANRLNAQKSTGPTSPEGKAASSLNALKSGIDAWSQIIPGEDPDELEALVAQFRLRYQPAGPTQLSLVDTLISTEWIQRRLRRIEAQL